MLTCHLKLPLFLLVPLLLSGCDKYFVSVSQQKINASYLASTHVNTPDPRREHPPIGQMLVIEWQVPEEILNKRPKILLDVIFWNYTEETETFPIVDRAGTVTYSLLDAEYEKKKGILTYKAEIVTEDGEVFREWRHQLWVKLIHVQEENIQQSTQESEESSSSVVDQSTQESVTEIPCCKEGETLDSD